ncbi:MAG: CDP-glycerol glycerophosphotransferase family protein [Paracoccaceae bacterium]
MDDTRAETAMPQFDTLSLPAPGRSFPIAFVDGACDDDTLLRHHILAPIKAALLPQTPVLDLGRDQPAPPGALRVSLFPNVPGDILMMFDLADRNHFRQFAGDGRAYVRDFRKVLVPGNWLRRHLLADKSLHLTESDVVAVGAPRIDHLRALTAALPAKPADAPLTVLFAPVHDNWQDRHGQPMCLREAMAPYLTILHDRVDLRVAIDGRNKDFKQPVTDDLLAADIVITDYTSVMYEAWALGKPVIFPGWLGAAERIEGKVPHCAEAQIYRDRIGHHADSFDSLLALLVQGRSLPLGPGVAAFMADYLANWADSPADAPLSGPVVARLLERLADPERALREREDRVALDAAIAAKNWATAEPLLGDLLRTNPDEGALYDKQAVIFNAQGKWWQELDALETATCLLQATPALFNRLGLARLRMGRTQGAGAAFAEAIRLAPQRATADLHYRMGYAFETVGTDGPADPRQSADSYKLACARDPKSVAARFGHGALHAAAGRWKEAQGAYLARLTTQTLDAELHYRLGMAHDRCYEWDQAEAAYRRALALDLGKAAWHYRLGFVLERQEKFDAAAAAYLHAATLSKTHQPSWFYRAGYALEKAGRLIDACDAFAGVQPGPTGAIDAPDAYTTAFANQRAALIGAEVQTSPDNAALWAQLSLALEAVGDLTGASEAASKAMILADEPNLAYAKRQAALDAPRRECKMLEARLNRNCTRPKDWLRYSEVLEALGNTDAAVQAMQQAVLRSNDHMPAWHHRLGLLLARKGDLPAACAAFRDQQILQRPHGIYEDRFAKQAALREIATYREFFDVLPITANTILYESFGGEGCSDNPLAIFTHVQADPRFAGWQHFWVVDDMSKAPAELCNRRDVFFVLKETQLYQRLLCTVEYLINNATFPFYYVRKDGQDYLNTWHGTPLKTLGYDIEATPLQRANTARNLIQASLFIAPNAHTESVMLDRYGARNLFTGRSLLTGYPRIDMMVNAGDDEKARIRKVLGLDPSKPVVLFAPTYRGHWATPELEAQSLADTIERMKSPDYNLVFRGHYFAEKFILQMDLNVTIAPHAIDTCSLLSVVDVLVTDYSSIFYDFLITKRPVVHFVPDWDYYVETRGVYFGKDQLPGIVCETEDHLVSVLEDCIRSPDAQISSQYLADLEQFCSHEDGKASARTIEAFFFNREAPRQAVLPKGARHLLVHGGDLGDGAKLSALRDLLSSAKTEGDICTLIVDRRVIIDDDTRTSNAQALLPTADVLIRFGKACFSLEEAWVNDKITTAGYHPSAAMRAVFNASLAHEVRRLFGHAQFDTVLEFDSRRAFWSNLLSAVPAGQRMIRLPGDLAQAITQHSPGLERLIPVLPAYDLLLSENAFVEAANKITLDGMIGPANCFAQLPPCVAGAGDGATTIQTRAAQPPQGPDAQDFVSRSGLRLLGVPGTDPVALNRMLSLLEQSIAAGQGSHLGLIVPQGAEGTMGRRLQRNPLRSRVVLLCDGPDPLPLMAAADCILIDAAVEFGGHLAAEAQTLGKPCLILAAQSDQDDAEVLAAALAGQEVSTPGSTRESLSVLMRQARQ